MTPRWNDYFFGLCGANARMSKDPSTRVGAVIARPDGTVASMGWNGFPRGAKDDAELYADRPTKLLRTVHAEVNAIVTAREPLVGYTLFVAPLFPCANCTGVIIQSGIRKVVARCPDEFPERWAESFQQAAGLMREAGVAFTIVGADGRPLLSPVTCVPISSG